jgi:glycosyltransferase involved in cell wall biosynthesis
MRQARPVTSPLVTVCVPTYNGVEFLREALDSVCSQSYTELEILIVDDRSSDGTLDILDSYRNKDNRVRVQQNAQNRGLVGNWKRCVELARGEYIKFAFQDDVLLPSCVKALVDAALTQNVRFTFCAREFIFEEGALKGDAHYFERHRETTASRFGTSDVISPEQFCSAVVQEWPMNIVGEPIVTLLHKSVFADYGSFNRHLLQLCDYEYWCRIGANEPIVYVPEVLARFRVHDTATTSKNRARRLYRMHAVDNLLLLHEFALSPTYSRLRKIAQDLPTPIDLVDRFYEDVHWKNSVARDKAADPMNPDTTEITALQELAATYPAVLGPVPLRYALARKWRTAKWLIRQRIGTSVSAH